MKHTLVSLDKWESKYEKPLISKTPRTRAERLDYIKCMVIAQWKDNKWDYDVNGFDIDERLFMSLDESALGKIDKYCDTKMTATTFRKTNERGGNRFVTAEFIYFWMSTFNIPYIPCQDWNLNKLLTLIKVCSEENKGSDGKHRRETPAEMADRRALNEARKKALGTRG